MKFHGIFVLIFKYYTYTFIPMLTQEIICLIFFVQQNIYENF